MRENTYISNVLEGSGDKVRYDAEVKKVLSDKTVLAWILRYAVEEFKEYPVEVIRDCIEGEPETGTRRVAPGHTPEAVTGSDTADKVPGEGAVFYDVRFSVLIPGKERVKLIINVEGQKGFYPGYDLVTRSVFYCARLLSSQLGTEFTGKDYDDIKKVYSIWICMEVPEEIEYTVTAYRLSLEELYGHADIATRYDLMESVIICLGKEEHAGRGNRLHRMLSTLFSRKLRPVEKEAILEREYGFVTSVELEGGIRQMCNLSDLIEEQGKAEGLLKGRAEGLLDARRSLILKKIKKGKSVEQIADELEEPLEDILPVYKALKEEQEG